ncbi:MAG: PEP-CTERM sorting domain-containing protein [Thiobacillus sp.]|nr:PEP-CTERM sorting domain-containing protein [Thiobacillus sp.]
MLNSLRVVFAACALLAAGVVHAVTFGDLRVEEAMTLDASEPEFQFVTFEILSGGSVTFTGLDASDTLILRASQAIRIDGAMILAPALSIRIEAPQIVLGAGAVLDLPGGSIVLIADGPSGGTILLDSGATLVAGGTTSFPVIDPIRSEPIMIGDGSGRLIVVPRGDVTLQAPVPEAETYAMMLAGLGLIGFSAARRKMVR